MTIIRYDAADKLDFVVDDIEQSYTLKSVEEIKEKGINKGFKHIYKITVTVEEVE